MEKTKKIGAQIYGYTVCLVAVITILISITTLVNAVLDLSDPLHSGWTPAGSPSLASYENYKMDILKSLPKGEESAATTYVPDDQTLKVMYEAAREDKIQSVRHNSNKNIIVSSFLIIICIVLFVTHWRWMRNLSKAEG